MATGWQDPQVYLAAAAAGKSSVTYHDIVYIVTKHTIDELIVAGVHDGSQLDVKTGSKAQLESITHSQWSIANLAIMYTLLSEGKLVGNAVMDHLSYTTIMIGNTESCRPLMVSTVELIYPPSHNSAGSSCTPTPSLPCLAHSRGPQTFHSVHVRWTEGPFVNCTTVLMATMFTANLCLYVRISKRVLPPP